MSPERLSLLPIDKESLSHSKRISIFSRDKPGRKIETEIKEENQSKINSCRNFLPVFLIEGFDFGLVKFLCIERKSTGEMHFIALAA